MPGMDRGRNRQRRDFIIERAFRRDLLLLRCGDNTVRFCPPIVVSTHEVDTCLRLIEGAAAEVETGP